MIERDGRTEGTEGGGGTDLKVKGIIMLVKKAGMAWLMSAQSMCCDSPIIMAPTRMRIGAVAAVGTRSKSGARKTEAKKRSPTVTAVRPVRPPSRMPAADSTCTMMGLHPAMAATTVPRAELRNAQMEPGTRCPSASTRRAKDARPNMTPETSKMPTKRKARRGRTMSFVRASREKSRFRVTPYCKWGTSATAVGPEPSTSQTVRVMSTMPASTPPFTCYYWSVVVVLFGVGGGGSDRAGSFGRGFPVVVVS